jgi:hypothetical protein
MSIAYALMGRRIHILYLQILSSVRLLFEDEEIDCVMSKTMGKNHTYPPNSRLNLQSRKTITRNGGYCHCPVAPVLSSWAQVTYYLFKYTFVMLCGQIFYNRNAHHCRTFGTSFLGWLMYQQMRVYFSRSSDIADSVGTSSANWIARNWNGNMTTTPT